MDHFKYSGDHLFCEGVSVEKIAKEVGTPFYLYSHATLTRHYSVFNNAFNSIKNLVCYSAKANTSLAVLKLFQKLGSGLDIVSGGELFRGLKAGFSPDKIVYSGVGKRTDEIDYALKSRILMFNVESMEELCLINQRAKANHMKAPVAIRVNPDVNFTVIKRWVIRSYWSKCHNTDNENQDKHDEASFTHKKPPFGYWLPFHRPCSFASQTFVWFAIISGSINNTYSKCILHPENSGYSKSNSYIPIFNSIQTRLILEN